MESSVLKYYQVGIFVVGLGSIFLGIIQHLLNSRISVESHGYNIRKKTSDSLVALSEATTLVGRSTEIQSNKEESDRLSYYHKLVINGTSEYINSQYSLCLSFSVFFTLLIFSVLAIAYENFIIAISTSIAFLLGNLLCIMMCSVGIEAANYTAIRTAISSQELGRVGYQKSFMTAFRGGGSFVFPTTGSLNGCNNI